MQKENSRREDAIRGSLLGTAVGDALGLPLERLTPQRARKLFGEITEDYGMQLLRGRGLVSDDTEHALLTLQAFVASDGDADRFQNELARGLKKWFLLLPPGIGLATAKACFKLLVGISPARAGTFSAGNGPAMRAPILGVLLPDDDEQLRLFVRISTRLTHTDDKAELGALAVAFAARCAASHAENQTQIAPREFVSQFDSFLQYGNRSANRDNFLRLLEEMIQSVESGQSTPDFALACGFENGVSGYIFHTVPVCLHAWLAHQHNFRKTILETLRCGGDADSTAAIAGGIAGAQVGGNEVPKEWTGALSEWPKNVRWMESLARASARNEKGETPLWFIPATLARNLFLLAVVIFHALRRVLPPY